MMCFDETPATSAASEPVFHSVKTVEFTPEQQAKVNEIESSTKRKERERAALERSQLTKRLQDIQNRADTSESARASLQNEIDQLKMASGEYESLIQSKEQQWNQKLQETESTYKNVIASHESYRAATEVEKAANANNAFDSSLLVQLAKDEVKFVGALKNPQTGQVTPAGVYWIDPVSGQIKGTASDYVVEKMKSAPQLFRSMQVSGAGAFNVGLGGAGNVSSRPIDWNNITPAEYAQLRKEGTHPSVRGLSQVSRRAM
jgi:hypothetical protein